MSLDHDSREIDKNLLHGFDTSVHGFDTEVLTPSEGRKPPAYNGGSTIEDAEKERLLIISKNSEDKHNKVKRKGLETTRSWKSITTSGTYYFEGRDFEINSKRSGCYLPIVKKVFEQTFAMFYKYKRVLLVSVTLKLGRYEDSNKEITKFRKRFIKRLISRYGYTVFGFIWAREFSKNGNIHYHLIWLIDGDLARNPFFIYEQMKGAAQAGGMTFNYSKNYHFIDSVDGMHKALKHASYLSKVATKGLRPLQTKDYGSSRLKFVSKLGKPEL